MDTAYTDISKLLYNQVFIKELTLTTPQKLSIPYWLENNPTDGMYVVDDQQMRGIPTSDPSITALVNVTIGGQAFIFTTPVIFKTVDPAEGEITRPLSVIPPVTVVADNEVLMFKEGQPRKIQLTLAAAEDNVSGELMLKTTNPEWKVSPETVSWSFEKAGETKTILCTVTPPNNSSTADLLPQIKTGDHSYHHKITTIDYDHLPYMSVVTDGTIHLQSMDIVTTARSIAYIAGAGDDVPASLRQLDYNIDERNVTELTSDLLSKYQVIILGIRAFNTVEDLAHKNKILFDWVRSGGTLIVQYNVSRGLVTEEIAPYALTLSRDRITEENSLVTIIDPTHEVLNFPNKINASDFDGWTQERGLYFPNAWDSAFTPILEMKDTGGTPTQGALLVAQYGEGYYVYSGLSWFRHLPAGNPGPYRLLSNLIALGSKKSKS